LICNEDLNSLKSLESCCSSSAGQDSSTTPTTQWLNPLLPTAIECPFDFFAKLRRKPPVCLPDARFFLISRYDDVEYVLLHPELFSSSGSPGLRRKLPSAVLETMLQGFRPRPSLQTTDPPVHQRYRSLFSKAFSSHRVTQLEPLIREIANELVDRFIDDHKVELVSQFASPLSLTAFMDILGVPRSDAATLKRWSDDAAAPLGEMMAPERELECAQSELEAQQYFAAIIDERRREPRDDFLTDLCHAHLGRKGPLDNQDIFYLLLQLLVAGHETTASLISSAMLLLLKHPMQMAAVSAEPDLTPNFIEESLRLEPPIKAFFRVARAETELGGVKIPAGSRLAVLFASANRDESRFPDPERFDIYRQNASDHLAFGQGIHYCLGAPLARTEGRIAFEVLLRRLKNLRLGDGNDFSHTSSFVFRGLKALRLQFSS
jgi:cytochrome P450